MGQTVHSLKKLFNESNCKYTEKTPSRQYLLQSNFLSNQAHRCASKYTLASCGKQLSRRKQNQKNCLQNIFIWRRLFLRSISLFESFCWFKLGCLTAVKNNSSFFDLGIFISAYTRTFHWKIWPGCWGGCMVGSEHFWILMLIVTSINISFSFTYVIFFTRTDSLLDFTWKKFFLV